VFIHLIAISLYSTVVDRLIDALKQVTGAYSLVALTGEALIGVRDPLGVRPLVLGAGHRLWLLASETCALDIVGAEFVRDVEPGEIVVVTEEACAASSPSAATAPASAFSNTSTSPGPTRWWKAPRLRRAQAHRRQLARESRRPMSWCRCRTAACRRRSATR
jgi:asparagine synthetase B (glutamine-hydrolysing)